MLKLENINVILNKIHILKDINFEFKNWILIVFWKSGSWKSTLLNTILWSVKPTKWKIYLKENNKYKDITWLKIEQRNIWILFQDLILFPNLTIEENINVWKNKDNNLKENLIKKFWIKHLLKKYPHEISWGEAQRVALIRTVITKPKILLLDEPFSSLDEINKKIIKQEIKSLVKELNIPTILISHDIDDINYFWWQFIEIEDWKIKKQKIF